MLSGKKVMCKICNIILKYKDPKLYNKYETCSCLNKCDMEEKIIKYEPKYHLKKLYEYWNNTDNEFNRKK
jgi:hypothetical protein